MAEKKTKNEKVRIRIPKTRGDVDDLVVIVNGKATQIPRGKWWDVDPSVAEVINNAAEQNDMAIDFEESLREAYHSKNKGLE